MVPTKVTFISPATHTNKVAAIKSIRGLTGLGLKEAKDASELNGKVQTFAVVPMPESQFEEYCRILRSEGYEVGETVHKILQELRKLASDALLMGEDELGNEITQLILAEKLRRQPGMT